MPDITGFSVVDLLIAVLLLFFIYKGMRNGFMKEIGKILALIAGFMCANQFAGFVNENIFNWIVDDTARSITSYLVLFFAAALIVSLVVRTLQKLFEFMLLGWLNKILGTLLGFLKGFLIIALVIFVLEAIPASNELHNRMTSDSPLYGMCNGLKNWVIENSTFGDSIQGIQDKVKKNTDPDKYKAIKDHLSQ